MEPMAELVFGGATRAIAPELLRRRIEHVSHRAMDEGEAISATLPVCQIV